MPNPPFPEKLSGEERRNLKAFDELDFEVFSHADWSRLGESHARNIRVHWPDGHYTDGVDKHIADLAAMFVWAPDTRIESRSAVGALTVAVGHRYPLQDIAEAHERVDAGGRGRILVTVPD